MRQCVNIYWNRGIYVEGRRARFVVDPVGPVEGPVDFVLVTHGHSDHVSRYMFKHLVVATAETFKAIEVKFGGVPPRRLVTAPGRVFEVGGVEVAVFDAGHIVGSVMYLVELDGVQILITGDYSVYGSILTDGAEPVEKPDILITEATYGDPAYVFPNKADVYNELLDLVERHAGERGVAIAAYPLGKAQEVSALLGSRAKAHPLVARYNRALGIRSGTDGDVVVVPSLKAAPPGFVKVEATGWYSDEEYRRRSAERGIYGVPLSDHSDYVGLIEFVNASAPKLVYTVYGFSERLARSLRRLGHRAYTIPGAAGLSRFLK
ncbi:putative mRNA 3-end processing factor [Pyrobaculum calidifontis JCM 11548]|uniref:mRNA 3-end processing factor n=1 Tax=Pyrobaculum calidifontis (strain DSM 21063 / JCM 11548 / VA1) TaxID=410359 RepID=A3MV01_PYRCJ|nr:putative mRNA 3-end processing factor [Pyrobaculum calidifontis JCM 11548]